MLCKQCGQEIPENAAFCPSCGCPVVEETPTAGETTVLSEEMQYNAAEYPTEQPTPKKRHFPVKWLIAAVVAVVAVVALVLNMNTLVGTVIKTFGSDTEYYKYVELKTVKDGTDTMSGYYARIKEAFTDPEQKVQGTLRPVVGEEALELLQDLPVDVELDWLNDLTLSYTGNYKDNKLKLELALAVADGDPLKAIGILSATDGRALLGVPSANEQYLEFALDAIANEDTSDLITAPPSGMESLLADPEFTAELKEVLPSEKELDKLLDRYLAIVLDMVEVKSAKNTTLDIDGVQQKCTKVELEITQKFAVNALLAVLTEAKDDDEIKEIVEKAQTLLEKKELIQDIDLYEEYRKAVDAAIDEMEDAKDEATDDTIVAMTTYISDSHEVIGRSIQVEQSEVLYYATAEKGGKYATEMTISDMAAITGSGTKKGDVVNGEYTVDVNGTTVATLTVTNFDEGKARDGYVNGTFRVTPKKALLEMLGAGDDVALLFTTYDPSLELVMENSKTESNVALYLYKDESVLFGLKSENKTDKAEEVTLPENTVDATDEEALSAWLDGVEGDTVLEKLENAGVPEQILDLLDSFIMPVGSDDMASFL